MPAELTGRSLGQYEILELRDDNGVIQTYSAVQRSLNRLVAIHVIKPEQRHDAAWQKALVKGAEIAANLEHPNIVPVIDYGKQDNIDYVALRLVEGGTLLQHLQQRRFQFREIASVVSQVAGALDYVHAQGKYHGDPAPINIIFDVTGNAYIADFYLAGFLEATTLEQIAGVPQFMAPERMVGNRPTPMSDQHSLAGIAYYMLTGVPPWVPPARARLPETIVLPQQHRPDIPLTVNPILLKALAKQPEDRYPTVLDFARQLEKILSSVNQHIFISYSRRDQDYTRQLIEHLKQNDLNVWVDNQIEHGDRWFDQINNAIQSCTAFIVIMSPDAEQSEWVQKEILLAKRYRKPIFPLLLKGEEFPILIDVQFGDVRNNQMPDTEFYRRISRSFYGS